MAMQGYFDIDGRDLACSYTDPAEPLQALMVCNGYLGCARIANRVPGTQR